MRRMFKTVILGTLAVILLGGVFACPASAQCAFPGFKKAGALESESWRGMEGSRAGSFLLAAEKEGAAERIVGFWKIKFVSVGTPGIPDGAVIDNGLAQWHSDGTEILNSSRIPATGNFCLGVWQKGGPSSYDLNHFALSFDPAGNFIGPAQIREHVTLNHKADQYEGTFTIDQDDSSGNALVHITGRVTATRITVDTSVREVL